MILDKFSKFFIHVLTGALLIVLVFGIGGLPVSAGNSSSLDVDDNGQADALTDGMLILRYLFGMSGSSLTQGALAPDASRIDPLLIVDYLTPLRSTMLDVDCNGRADAFTDGMLIARFLMGFTGTSLISGVVDPSGCRTTGDDIATFLTAYVPGGNAPPEAMAGNAETVPIGTTVRLDGHRSVDKNGDPLTYSWSFESVPSNSEAILVDPTFIRPSFLVDVAGEYRIQLLVNDGLADSPPSVVTISTTNSAPVADPGEDRHVQVGETVQLNGSRSHDVDGDMLTFEWVMTEQPAGSQVFLSDANAITPTLSLDVAGTYRLQLHVSDGVYSSPSRVLTLTTQNTSPLADAGPDQFGNLGETVHLDGHRSYDSDGDLLTFQWSLLSVPNGSAATLSDDALVISSLIMDLPGTYVAQLLVEDDEGEYSIDTVVMTTDNVSPIARAGNDRVVDESATPAVLLADGSTDLNGQPLTFSWSLLSAPEGSAAILTHTNSVRAFLDIDLPGTYFVQVMVHDGFGGYDVDTVLLSTGNAAQKAWAGLDQIVHQGQTAFFDSTDSDEEGDGVISQNWHIVAKPSTSMTSLQDASTPLPSLDIDQEGQYVVSVTVTDFVGAQDRDAVVVRTDQSRPVAKAWSAQEVIVGNPVILNGNFSSDVDADSLTYRWGLTALPSGSQAFLEDSTAPTPELVPDVEGLYLVQLVVTDSTLLSMPDTVLLITSGASFSAELPPGSVRMIWNQNAEADLNFYKVYFGRESGMYTTTLNVGLTITPATPYFMISGLPSGTYYFAVTAVDTAGNESAFSEERMKIVF